MHARDINRNLLLYHLYVVFNDRLFSGAIIITSLQQLAQMSLPDIYYMESVVLCICVVLDIPSGVLADLMGRKKTLIIGRIFLFASAVLFTVMANPLEAWLGNILWAIGFSMQSGADSALLSETLRQGGNSGDYKRVQGRAVGFQFIVIAFCAVSTGLLAAIDLRLPLWIGLPFMLIPLVAVVFLKEPSQAKRSPMQKQKMRTKDGIRVLKQGCGFALRSAEIRWVVGFAALLGTTSKVWFFTYNPYFELVQLPLPYYGMIFFCLNIVAGVSSRYAYKIEQWLGERRCIMLMVLSVGVPILLMGCIPIQPFAYLVIVQNVLRGLLRPFVGDYLNRRITDDIRATVLSVQSSVTNLVSIVGLAAFGLLADAFGLLTSLILLGVIAIGFGALSYVTYIRKIAPRSE